MNTVRITAYREREWDTQVGIMCIFQSSAILSSILEPRRRTEQALLSVVQEVYIDGVSTRKVDEPVKSLGISGISKSEVSHICKDLDVVQ